LFVTEIVHLLPEGPVKLVFADWHAMLASEHTNAVAARKRIRTTGNRAVRIESPESVREEMQTTRRQAFSGWRV
jgi:hypothetical protein